MKTNFLIIIGIATSAAVLISSYAIYDSSTLVFIECVPPYEQVDGRCLMPTFEILLDTPVYSNSPLTVSVEKTGYYMCDEWSAKIIDNVNDSPVWEKAHDTLCVVQSPPKQQKFTYEISNENNPILIDGVGIYLLQIDIGGKMLQEEFHVLSTFDHTSLDETASHVLNSLQNDSLRPDDRLEVQHRAGYTVVEITLSSWDEYHNWENDRGSEHDAMPPIPITQENIDPIVLDLLNEMWTFENYEVSKHNKNLFVKNISKDYGVSNHHGIHDWLNTEHDKKFGPSNDGFSSHFEFQDRVYRVTMLAID